MTDVPFVASARFRKVVQTAPYETEEAEISAQFRVEDETKAQATIEANMAAVKRQVLIALGKSEGTLIAVSTDPQKRGPGRPRKEQVPPEPPKPEPVEEKPAPEVTPDDFADEPQAAEEITDKTLQEECAKAAKSAGMDAAKVKNIFQKKYGAQRVSQIKQSERKAFIEDLKVAVIQAQAEV